MKNSITGILVILFTMNIYLANSSLDKKRLNLQSIFSNTLIDNDYITLSKIYPNPPSSHINFDYTFKKEVSVSIGIYNLVGRLLKKYELATDLRKITIPVYYLEEGIYFSTIEINGEKSHTTKFFIKR